MNTQLDRMWIATLSECNEVQRRRLAGIKALEIGRGGTTRVCALTGMSHLCETHLVVDSLSLLVGVIFSMVFLGLLFL